MVQRAIRDAGLGALDRMQAVMLDRVSFTVDRGYRELATHQLLVGE